MRELADDAPATSLPAASCSKPVSTDMICPKPLFPRSVPSSSEPALGAAAGDASSAAGSRCWASDSDDAAQAVMANNMEALRNGVLLQLDARRLCLGFRSGREVVARRMNRR